MKQPSKTVASEAERDKRVEQITEKWINLSTFSCSKCGGAGWYQGSHAEHEMGCDGSCKHCPVEVPHQEQCDCLDVQSMMSYAISEAWAFGEAEAYRKAAQTIRGAIDVCAYGHLRNNLAEKLDVLAQEAEERNG